MRLRPLLSAVTGLFALAWSGAAAAADGPGIEAVDQFRGNAPQHTAVENRFFLKEGRFEIAPVLGYVPNNPFAKRYVGGIVLGYHFNEQFSAQGFVSYSPDLGESDLKGLTHALVSIAAQGPGGADFQQPLDKITLAATFGGTWSPVYGKINLIGETVLNFDLYASAGLGIISKTNYFAVLDNSTSPPRTVLQGVGNDVNVTPNVGFGMNFFLTQTIALKLDGRFAFYLDHAPQYDPNEPVLEQRLYNNFVASVGMGFYFPRMKPRLYDF